MKRDFEYINQSDNDRLAMLEHRAAELERRLGQVTPEHGVPEYRAQDFGTVEFAAFSPPPSGGTGRDGAAHRVADARHAYQEAGPGFQYADSGFGFVAGVDGPDVRGGSFQDAAMDGHPAAGADGHPVIGTGGYPAAGTGGFPAAGAGGFPAAGRGPYRPMGTGGYPAASMGGYPNVAAAGYPAAGTSGYPDAGVGGPDERTEVLINRGRRNARQTGVRRLAAHWRALAVGLAAATVALIIMAVVLPGGGATWPASVATVQSEISAACQNPNVVAEPTQVNFACDKETRQVLWVFSLLTSGDNPGFTDPSNGRKGLEPIAPAQGGDIAWSLNLHHPYDPTSPTDSLSVAARAINNIIGGATLTGSSGAPVVQNGLESSPANCARYTGSSSLVTKQGFPALCALPISSPSGLAALVSDVFQQWMVGTPARIASEAGVLFENADNPGDPQVQAILNSLPQSGL